MWPAAVALAHPLGNFTVNRYSRIELSSGAARVRYVLDMAEIPTFQEMAAIDSNRDGRADDAERAAYLPQKVEQLRQGLSLRINSKPALLRAATQELSFPAGQGGLPTMRLVATFDVESFQPGALAGAQQLDYRDDNYSDRLGWKEIVVRAVDGIALTRSTVSAEDRSAELTRYPDDMLASPLDEREAHATFEPAPSASSAVVPQPAGLGQELMERARDQLAALMTTDDLSWPVIAFSLAAAFGLGALHSLSPGHGKTIVGAYLVGSQGTWRHALFLGLTVTLTHTAGVFVLGLVTLFASQFILPERLYPWLSVISGLLVISIGASLFVIRLRAAMQYDGEHDHHRFSDHVHTHDPDPFDTLRQAQGARLRTGDGGHQPPPNAIAWRSLLALGVSGGLLPCPSALVVLLSAISLHRVGFGLILIVAFSAGLAGVLTAIGLLLVYAGRLFERLRAPGPIGRLLPVGSALVVTLLGVVILAQALAQASVL